MDLKEIGCESLEYIQPAEDNVTCQAFVKIGTEFVVSMKDGKILDNLIGFCLSRGTLLHGVYVLCFSFHLFLLYIFSLLILSLFTLLLFLLSLSGYFGHCTWSKFREYRDVISEGYIFYSLYHSLYAEGKEPKS
jgi:hypothetical protein